MKTFKRDMKNHQNSGFTMIEVVVASMLLTMVLLTAFPMFRTGKAIVDRKQRTQEIEFLGDRMFDRVARELQHTEIAYFGTKGAAYRLDESMFPDSLDDLEDRLEQYRLDVEILAEPMEDGWFLLLVKLSEDGTVQYNREEMILSLNYGLWQKSIGQ